MARRRNSRGFNRQVRRKFVWDRTFGSVPVGTGGPFGVDLLANFRAQPGATHLGATVTRIRGMIIPSVTPPVGGVVGFRIDSWNEDILDPDNAPTEQPDEDWLGWLPWQVNADSVQEAATWNPDASMWAVDIKSQRKLEELNQTLWMLFTAPSVGTITYSYNLSVGLKLA